MLTDLRIDHLAIQTHLDAQSPQVSLLRLRTAVLEDECGRRRADCVGVVDAEEGLVQRGGCVNPAQRRNYR